MPKGSQGLRSTEEILRDFIAKTAYVLFWALSAQSTMVGRCLFGLTCTLKFKIFIVRMLLKNGYRHVYISRKFALRHGFIPGDAAPGHYGYSGLVNLGKWPITLKTAADFTHSTHTNEVSDAAQSLNHSRPSKSKTVSVPVFLSEEPHFDVVLGRSFFEKRQIKTSSIDPTEVICLDTGDKIECELVILKDGRGQIVTVT